MTWEEKFKALSALSRVEVKMLQPNDYRATVPGVEIGGDGFLLSTFGTGKTAEDSVNALWDKFVDGLTCDRCLVIHAYSDDRREVAWNGFMWEDREIELKV